jgi:hypothetical protein
MAALLLTMNFDRWIALVGLIGTITGVGLAIYYARRAEKRRVPTFVISPKKITLVSDLLYAVRGCKVLQNDGIIAKNGLTEILVHFFNGGNLPILKEEILTPFQVELPADCPVRDYSVVKQSRGVIAIEVSSLGNFVLLDFALLEPNDGGTVRIVYEGPLDVKVKFNGSCIGASSPTVLPSETMYFLQPFDRIKPFLAVPLMAVLSATAAAILLGGMAAVFWVMKRVVAPEHVATLMGGLLVIIVVGAIGSEMHRRLKAKVVPPNIY